MVKRTVLPARARLLSAARILNANECDVGFFADQGQHKSGMNYPTLMWLQEVHGVSSSSGLIHRRLFEKTMMIYRQAIVNNIRLSMKRNLLSNPRQVYHDAGEDIRKHLLSGFGDTAILQSNMPSTIAKKGFNSPLIETGDLKSKLTYRVKKRTKKQ